MRHGKSNERNQITNRLNKAVIYISASAWISVSLAAFFCILLFCSCQNTQRQKTMAQKYRENPEAYNKVFKYFHTIARHNRKVEEYLKKEKVQNLKKR